MSGYLERGKVVEWYVRFGKIKVDDWVYGLCLSGRVDYRLLGKRRRGF